MALADGAPSCQAQPPQRVSSTQVLSDAAGKPAPHGGMGYTWEMDCHLFCHARQQAVELGSIHAWRASRWRPSCKTIACSCERDDWAELDRLTASPWTLGTRPRKPPSAPDTAPGCQANAVPKASADDYFGRDADCRAAHGGNPGLAGQEGCSGFGCDYLAQDAGWPWRHAGQELIWRQEGARSKVPTGMFNVSLGMVLPSVMAHASAEVLATNGPRHWAEKPLVPVAERAGCRLRSGHGAHVPSVPPMAVRAGSSTGKRSGPLSRSLPSLVWYWTRTNPQSQQKFEGDHLLPRHEVARHYRAPDSPGRGESEFNEVFFGTCSCPIVR